MLLLRPADDARLLAENWSSCDPKDVCVEGTPKKGVQSSERMVCAVKRGTSLCCSARCVALLLDLGPNNWDTPKLGPLLASGVRHTSKRVEHGAGFTGVHSHPVQVASRHPCSADRSRTHSGPRTADHPRQGPG